MGDSPLSRTVDGVFERFRVRPHGKLAKRAARYAVKHRAQAERVLRQAELVRGMRQQAQSDTTQAGARLPDGIAIDYVPPVAGSPPGCRSLDTP